MATNESRSLNGELFEGKSDGSRKKDTPDRGGNVEFDARQYDRYQGYYGDPATAQGACGCE